MNFQKRIGQKGGISIPAALRRQYGIAGGERIDISVDEAGRVIIKRIIGSCIFCKSDTELKSYNGRYICGPCAAKIKEL
ncbi:MAG: AbrB/MazE/SpoVT family DNA-binding domain-containing protein [Sporomusaceae bacterium]|jgi:transcriptional pleiotropic regulator of transition state genes|nr:AbrB/MazE/SpoVT family DNA-binding domain-containing protein [Sporomusaceae bacterium]